MEHKPQKDQKEVKKIKIRTKNLGPESIGNIPGRQNRGSDLSNYMLTNILLATPASELRLFY